MQMENMKRVINLAAVAALILFAAAPPKARADHLHTLFAKITAAVMSGNTAKVSWAQGEIETLLKGSEHGPANAELYYVWLRRMLLHHDDAAIVHITQMENLLAPGDVSNVWHYQMYRTEALLVMGHRKAALRNAKMLFNVVPSTQVAQAAILVYRCLLAQKSDGAELAREFCREQMAGAKPPKAGQPPKTCDVLAGITIHGKAYEDDVRRQVGVGTFTLVARGNLWLLADHPNKALKCFKAAYDIATPGELAMVCDRIAAAMRAKYGTIGAANAWLKSLAR